MPSCAVAGCKNRSASRNRKVKYFSFPKNENYIKLWLSATGRPPNEINTKNARICSDHFESSCMKNYLLKHRLLHYFPTNFRCLSEDAVPTLNLPPLVSKTMKTVTNDNIINANQVICLQIVTPVQAGSSNLNNQTQGSSEKIKEIFRNECNQVKFLQEKIAFLQNENRKIGTLEETVTTLKTENFKLGANCKRLTDENEHLKAELQALKELFKNKF